MDNIQVILLKYGEIVLKGQNRGSFERAFERNVRAALESVGRFDLAQEQSAMTVTPADAGQDMDGALRALGRVFGAVVINRAVRAEKSLEGIETAVRAHIPAMLAGARTFKCESKRSDKSFPLTSPQISAEVGHIICEILPEIKVDLYNPEVTVVTEVRDGYAYIYAGKLPGAGGLPVGVSGRGTLLLSGGIDSPAAAYMMSRRGMEFNALHFTSEPYTSPRALEKVEKLCAIIRGYNPGITLSTICLTEIQEAIRDKCDESCLTLILRRFMMELACMAARRDGGQCLVTGESLGQVASQTIHAIAVTDAAADLPVMRPLIGMDKSQIIEIARNIGTYETSIIPFDDCCTVFVPRHPLTKPRLEKILAEEARLDKSGLMERAFATLKHIM